MFQLPTEKDKKDTKKPIAKEVVKDEEAEELEVVKDDKKKSDPSHDDSQIATDSSIALVFARFQNERGTLSNFDEESFSNLIKEQGEEGALEFLYDNEVETRLNEVKQMYAQDRAEILEYIELKDAGLDADTAKRLASSKAAFEGITDDQLEDDEKLTKQVLVQNYKNTTKWSNEKIEKHVEKLITNGEAFDEAKEVLPDIKKFNEEQIKAEKQARVEADKQAQLGREAQVKKLKDTIYSMTEIMGQPVGKPAQQKIEKFLAEDGIKNWFSVDPEKKTAILGYAISTGLLDGNLGKIKDKVKTSVIKELEDKFNRKSNTLDGDADTSFDSSGSGLNSLKHAFGNLD